MTPEQIMTVCRASRVASLRVFGDWQCDLKLLPEFQTVLNSVFLQLALDSTVPAGVVVCPLPVPMAPARVVFGLLGHYSLDCKAPLQSPLLPHNPCQTTGTLKPESY